MVNDASIPISFLTIPVSIFTIPISYLFASGVVEPTQELAYVDLGDGANGGETIVSVGEPRVKVGEPPHPPRVPVCG